VRRRPREAEDNSLAWGKPVLQEEGWGANPSNLSLKRKKGEAYEQTAKERDIINDSKGKREKGETTH